MAYIIIYGSIGPIVRIPGTGKTKIPTEAMRAPRPILLQSWRESLTYSRVS